MPDSGQYLDRAGVVNLLKGLQKKLDSKIDETELNDIRIELASLMSYFENGELEITGFTNNP